MWLTPILHCAFALYSTSLQSTHTHTQNQFIKFWAYLLHCIVVVVVVTRWSVLRLCKLEAAGLSPGCQIWHVSLVPEKESTWKKKKTTTSCSSWFFAALPDLHHCVQITVCTSVLTLSTSCRLESRPPASWAPAVSISKNTVWYFVNYLLLFGFASPLSFCKYCYAFMACLWALYSQLHSLITLSAHSAVCELLWPRHRLKLKSNVKNMLWALQSVLNEFVSGLVWAKPKTWWVWFKTTDLNINPTPFHAVFSRKMSDVISFAGIETSADCAMGKHYRCDSLLFPSKVSIYIQRTDRKPLLWGHVLTKSNSWKYYWSVGCINVLWYTVQH